jgi:hypothetical protein
MPNIQIKRYSRPLETGWAGYIEPTDASWIAFVGLDGLPRFFLHRDPVTGAILPDDPAEREGWIRVLRSGEQPGLRIGMVEDGSAGPTALAPGERVYPVGFDGRAGLAGRAPESGGSPVKKPFTERTVLDFIAGRSAHLSVHYELDAADARCRSWSRRVGGHRSR